MLERLHHLAAHERMYRDFEFAYGAGLLYLPLWCSRLVHHRLMDGYFLVLSLEWILGVGLAAYCVHVCGKGLGAPSRRCGAIFLALVFTNLSWWTLSGAQYTPVRYWLAPAVAVCSFSAAERTRSAYLSAAAVVLPVGFALLLWISPEQAIALLGGTLLWVAFFPRQPRPMYVAIAALCAVAVPLLVFTWRSGGLSTLWGMQAGAYAIPVTLTAYLLPALGLLLLAACDAVEQFRRHSAPAVTTYLVCLAIVLLPSAMGRYDEVHLLSNTFAGALVGWFVLARDEALWPSGLGAYFLLVIALHIPALKEELGNLGRLAQQTSAQGSSATAKPIVLPAQPIYAPFESWLTLTPSATMAVPVQLGHFFGLENVLTRAEAEEKAAEIRGQAGKTILVGPYVCQMTAAPEVTEAFTHGLYARGPRHSADQLQPICDELDRHWVEVPGGSLPYGFHLRRYRP